MKKVLRAWVTVVLCAALLLGTMATASAVSGHETCTVEYTYQYDAMHRVYCVTCNEEIAALEPCEYDGTNVCKHCGTERPCKTTFMNGDQVWNEKYTVHGGILAITGMPIPPAPAGKVFGGWYTKDNKFIRQGIKIDEDMTAYATWNDAPVFSAPTGPQDISANVGETVTMRVVAENATSYQWMVSDGKSVYSIAPIPGATDASYTTDPLTAENNGYQYYCFVRNGEGGIPSPTFTLHVIAAEDIPETGDGMDLFLLAGLALISMLGMLTLTARGRKRHAE